MESFAKKPMAFKFSMGKPESASEETAEPATAPADAEYTPDELGSVLAEAIKSGSGEAVYEAVAKIVGHCG